MEVSHFEFFAIVVFVMAVLGALAWRQIKRARESVEAVLERREEKARDVADSLKNPAKADEAWRRRVVHEADHAGQSASMEPFCGEGKKAIHQKQQNEKLAHYAALASMQNAYNSADAFKRRLNAGIANAKPTERKQESGPSAYDPYAPIIFAAADDAEPSRPPSHSSYSGHGGSFDGGGASGDWGGSSSSSSDCPSNSSDSGSSSCSSSD